jgi:hypothetical protein
MVDKPRTRKRRKKWKKKEIKLQDESSRAFHLKFFAILIQTVNFGFLGREWGRRKIRNTSKKGRRLERSSVVKVRISEDRNGNWKGRSKVSLSSKSHGSRLTFKCILDLLDSRRLM